MGRVVKPFTFHLNREITTELVDKEASAYPATFAYRAGQPGGEPPNNMRDKMNFQQKTVNTLGSLRVLVASRKEDNRFRRHAVKLI